MVDVADIINTTFIGVTGMVFDDGVVVGDCAWSCYPSVDSSCCSGIAFTEAQCCLYVAELQPVLLVQVSQAILGLIGM